jgi:hypothetical protein
MSDSKGVFSLVILTGAMKRMLMTWMLILCGLVLLVCPSLSGQRRSFDVAAFDRARVKYDQHWPMRQSSLLFAGLALDRAEYIKLWERLPADSTVEEVVRNFFVRQPSLWVEFPWIEGHR